MYQETTECIKGQKKKTRTSKYRETILHLGATGIIDKELVHAILLCATTDVVKVI